MAYERLLVKLGGSLGEAEGVLGELAAFPGELVLVHGGGPQIGAFLERLGYTTRFEAGERVTPSEQLEAVEMVLTRLGKTLAHRLSLLGRPAVAVSGRDAAFLQGRAEERLGRVGRIEEVDRAFLENLLSAGLTPVVAPIAVDREGALNVNADLAAAAVAGALALPVVFLTDVPGVLVDPEDPGSRIPQLSRKEAETLIAAGTVVGGMVPKVAAALLALDRGAPWAAIAAGEAGGLEAALSGQGGTRFSPGPV